MGTFFFSFPLFLIIPFFFYFLIYFLLKHKMVKTNRVEEVHDDKKPKILDIDGLVKWVLPLERKKWLMRKYTLAMSRMGYLYQLASSVTWVVTTTAIVVLLPMLLKIEWEVIKSSFYFLYYYIIFFFSIY